MRIVEVEASPLNVPMREPFAIATGAQTRVRNVLVRLRLEDGTEGYGEAAPFPAFAGSGETQSSALAVLRKFAKRLEGRDVVPYLRLFEGLERADGRGSPSALAAVQTAILDAWTKLHRMPLYRFFGGASDRVWTDVTIPIVPPERAREAARRIRRMGVGTIKIKVGADFEEDLERVRAVHGGAPRARLILDANQGFKRPETALRFLASLGKAGIRPALFEQPVPKEDLRALAEVSRRGGVPVAADESASTPREALRVIQARAAQVINIKFMKSGVWGALQTARIARAGGLGLMIGGMVESHLAMTAAAHFAAGLGGFVFVDLDTPLFFARDPMQGVRIGRAGLYDLAPVRAGIGVRPRKTVRVWGGKAYP